MILKYIFAITIITSVAAGSGRLFSIDYSGKRFLLDGNPFVYNSGEMHYFRVPPEYWQDRLQKIAYAGLNAVTTYVAWNIHEPQPGIFDYSGQRDLIRFIKLAQEANLLVILRPGPYICAEWEYGGFPGWLLADGQPFLTRRSDPKYMDAVDGYYRNLLPQIKPLLYHNGGPIIMVQIENEYGSTGVCDRDYMERLVDLHRQLLDDQIVLFTCDQSTRVAVECGRVNGTLTTVNFAPTRDVAKEFEFVSKLYPNNPLAVSELYSGWYDAWNWPHQTKPIEPLIDTLRQLRYLNASWSMYMFEGGSNFGYMSGTTVPQKKITTSYDYDAPLSEAGDMTQKYDAIRQFLNKTVEIPQPKNSDKYSYGEVNMVWIGNILDLLSSVAERPLVTPKPVNMEQTNHFYGYVLYRHIFQENYTLNDLKIPGVRDRGYVMIQGNFVGIVEEFVQTTLVTEGRAHETLDILVENWGRFNWGPEINHNKKGIIDDVFFGSKMLLNWIIIPINITRLFSQFETIKDLTGPRKVTNGRQHNAFVPSLYYGEFDVPNDVGAKDTFIDTCGWQRGQIFINGVNLGRYRPTQGPQETLYIPSYFLRTGSKNRVVFFELEYARNATNFLDEPKLAHGCL